MIQETGAGGHSAPYLDWRIAYAGVYAIAAAGQLDDFDNDFIDETDYETMADPARNEYQFRRFRDAIVKALAFLQARDEKPQRPGGAQALCVAARPPGRPAARCIGVAASKTKQTRVSGSFDNSCRQCDTMQYARRRTRLPAERMHLCDRLLSNK